MALLRSRLLATLVAFVLLLVAPAADAAFTPPPLRGHVMDQAGALEQQQVLQLDRKLDRVRQKTGFAVVVYLMASLPDGMSIEDVGYAAGNAWGVGSKGGDDGVLLLIALAEHKIRIETGKGVGGALTDVQSSHINREVIGPLLKEGRTFEAVNRGVDAIVKELRANTPGGTSESGKEASRRPPTTTKAGPADYVKFGVIALVIVGVIVLAIISPTFREILFWVLLFGRFGGGGGGGRRDDDDDGGSGYGGGGGTFGGGGSTDDY